MAATAERNMAAKVGGVYAWGCAWLLLCVVLVGAGWVAPVRAQVDRAALRNATAAVAATWMAEVGPTTLPWSWGEGVLVYGLLEAARALNATEPVAYVQAYCQYHLANGIRVFWSDKTTPALAVADLELAWSDPACRALLDEVVAYVMTAPRSTTQQLIYHLGKAPIHFIPRVFPDLWVDSLFHWVPTLHRMTALTGDAAYQAEAVAQLLGFLRNMQDPITGLLTHAYNDYPLNQQIPAYEDRAFWARGNGWVLSALIDTLEALPAADPARAELLARATTQEAALRAVQAPNGLYHTVVLNSTTYLETAGSALITYAQARGVRLGVFGAEARAAAERGMEGLMTTLIYDGERVEVGGTSLGTGPRPRLYPRIPTDSQVTYGNGAWLMAARQVLLL
jgi:unsaturated rhamnogalacturonyl hydrolase